MRKNYKNARKTDISKTTWEMCRWKIFRDYFERNRPDIWEINNEIWKARSGETRISLGNTSAGIVEKELIDIYRIPRYIPLIGQMERASRAASVNSANAFDKRLAYV